MVPVSVAVGMTAIIGGEKRGKKNKPGCLFRGLLAETQEDIMGKREALKKDSGMPK